MKKLLLATAASSLIATSAFAGGHEINVGIILGYTGPIESLVADMGPAAEFAFAEVNASGLLLGGKTLNVITGDSTCIDSAAATAVAEKQITADNVAAIVGADCSGVTGAIVSNVAVPNGVVLISPSATSPGLSSIDDNGLFFRTAPSDARQGAVMADVLNDKGIKEVAVTYTNNDYGKGLADAFEASFKALGGTITISAAHEDGKADYSAEVGALASAGGDILAVLGYADQGGKGIIQSALDTGAFDTFVMGDGMKSDSLIEAIGPDLNGSIGTQPGSDSDGTAMLIEMLTGTVGNPGGPFTAESYDAAALIALAIQAGGSADRASIAANVMGVANAPGEVILPGELAKGLQILADGGEINYEGASGVELIGPGEASGSYQEYEIIDGVFETQRFR
ncbi:MAG: branched-chain amino acid ABC transporter substrate-binding protein [Rhodobacteraceae bacterium]|nr:MAG: branched-chain amino acid ABC transporter substrate-binding protein [Paracoccaceae bacterium]